MIQHAWTVLCRSSAVDRDSNTVSLFEVMEQLVVSETQRKDYVPISSFQTVSLWYRGEEEIPESGFGRLELLAPDGESRQLTQYPVDLTHHTRLRHRANLIGLPFPSNGAGRYWLQVSRRSAEAQEWEVVSRLPLQVEIVAAPTKAAENQEAESSDVPDRAGV
jgi:hypothetical protein